MINIYLLIFTMVNMYIYNTTKNNFKNLNSEINFRDFIIYYIKDSLNICNTDYISQTYKFMDICEFICRTMV